MFGKNFIKLISFCLIIAFAVSSATAQTKRKTTKKKPIKKAAPTQTQAVSDKDELPEIKKNARPDEDNQTTEVGKINAAVKTNTRSVEAIKDKPVYFYEFAQPAFVISHIYIEHDENGKGKITFSKKDLSEEISDPLQLSTATMEKLNAAWQALNFLDSTENYQTARDYSNLGNMTLTMKKAGREREAEFNWTDNKDAKSLADEYRRIGQQFIWVFDINVARENQPLDAPRLIDTIDSLIRRNEISDASQVATLLSELSNDERIPLIARNHAAKLVSQIEKTEKKK